MTWGPTEDESPVQSGPEKKGSWGSGRRKAGSTVLRGSTATGWNAPPDAPSF